MLNLSIQMAVLASGIATFCALVLFRAYPLCTWFEWAGACCGGDDDTHPDP
jgi:hypothetical protein